MAERIVLDLRRMGIPEVPVVGRYDYREAHRAIDLHAHRGAMEVCYLAKGRQLYRVGSQDYVLQGGDVFVTFPGEGHSTGEAPQEKGRLYWLQIFLPKRRCAFLNSDAQSGAALIERLRCLPHRHFSGTAKLGRILDDVISQAGDRVHPLRKLTIQNRLVEFLLHVLDRAAAGPRAGVTPEISALLRYIDGNLHRRLPLADLAARLTLSLPRFKARFKQEVGIPPAEYIVRCKVASAQRQLSQTQSTVTQVAMDLGFSSSQYFATVFRRYTGAPPSRLRRPRAGSSSTKELGGHAECHLLA